MLGRCHIHLLKCNDEGESGLAELGSWGGTQDLVWSGGLDLRNCTDKVRQEAGPGMLKYAGTRPGADDSHVAGEGTAVRVKLEGTTAEGRLTGGIASIAGVRRRCWREKTLGGRAGAGRWLTVLETVVLPQERHQRR